MAADLMIGRQVGRWTVLREAAKRGGRRAYECRCRCGTVRVVLVQGLRNGSSRSCGCRKAEVAAALCVSRSTHGHSPRGAWSPTYRAWANMMWRVVSSSPKNAPYYRDRGIKVCERWQTFDNFLADMGERPDGLTLDRIDNDRGYEPGNCRWATMQEQSRNQRRWTQRRTA